jgi:CheY-like chemotaxis protein/predicted  nucleic acid-binding Zn-ribbon protein
MATKVLVFESDSAFANELTAEFQALGCELEVVDDGNVGLQMAAGDRPDLILLSIELPRMNGFSVCNKLKKDPGLKDIPLIIMSSESSEETFEQHRRLRTRAEDYVHKPIAFADLLQRVQRFVDIAPGGGPSSLEDAIIIDDDIAFEENDDDDLHTVMMDRPSMELLEGQGAKSPLGSPAPAAPAAPVQHARRPSSRAPSKMEVRDLDVDEFADAAFDRLLDGSQPPPPMQEAPLVDASPTEAPPKPSKSEEPAEVRPVTIPSLPEIDPEEFDRLRKELDRYRDEVVKLEQELSTTRSETRRLEGQVKAAAGASAEVERLQHQIEELKTRTSTAPARGGGAVSSREFLDLREALNKKDKEILALRDQMSQKEKDLLDARDVSLALEREKADSQDKLLEFEKQALDLRMSIDRLTVENAEERQKNTDLQAQLEASKKQVDERDSRLVEAEARRGRELEEQRKSLDAEHTSALDKQRQEADKVIVDLQGEKDGLVARVSELETQVSDRDGRIAGLETDKSGLSTRVSELEAQVSDRDGRIAGLETDKSGLSTRVSELETQVSDRDGRIAELKSNVGDLESRLGDRDARIGELESQVRDRDGKIGDLESRIREKDERSGGLEDDLRAARARIDEVEGEKKERDTRIRDLESSLAKMIMDRDALVDAKRELSEKSSDLEAKLGATLEKLEHAEASLAAELDRGKKNQTKWDQDKASLDRAKNALAAVLLQIEEVETRGLE